MVSFSRISVSRVYFFIFCFLFLFSSLNHARPDTAITYIDLNDLQDPLTVPSSTVQIVSTPLGFNTPIDHSGQVITVITKDDIKGLGLSNVKQALELVSGLNVVDSGGQASFFYRGHGSNMTKIMLDGISLLDPSSGLPLLDGLNLNDIERIEILSGGASTIHGSDAVAGVINIITQDPNQEGGFASIEGGTDYQSQSFSYNQKSNNSFIKIRGSLLRDQRLSALSNTEEKDLHSIDNLSIKLRHYFNNDPLDIELSILNQFSDLDGQNASFDYIDITTHNITTKQDLFAIQYALNTNHNLNTILRYSTMYLERDTISNYPYYASGRRNVISLRNLYTPTHHTSMVIGVEREEQTGLTSSTTKQFALNSLFLNTMFDYGAIGFQAGTRKDQLTTGSEHQSYSLSLYGTLPKSQTRLLVTNKTGFRAANASEYIFSTDPNDPIAPETSKSYEAALTQPLSSGQIGASVFESQIENEIIYDNDLFTYKNADDDTLIQGYTVFAEYLPLLNKRSDTASTKARITDLLQKVKVEYSNFNTDQKRVPDHKITATALLAWQKFNLGIIGIHVGKRQDNNNVLPSYNRADVTLHYRLNDTTRIWGKVINVFNESYEDTEYYATLGQTVSLGYSKSF